jgi:hypothetical protein
MISQPRLLQMDLHYSNFKLVNPFPAWKGVCSLCCSWTFTLLMTFYPYRGIPAGFRGITSHFRGIIADFRGITAKYRGIILLRPLYTQRKNGHIRINLSKLNFFFDSAPFPIIFFVKRIFSLQIPPIVCIIKELQHGDVKHEE